MKACAKGYFQEGKTKVRTIRRRKVCVYQIGKIISGM